MSVYTFINGTTMEIPTILEIENEKNVIKVNLPFTKEDYQGGGGEGIWALIHEKALADYKNNVEGQMIFAQILNDSVFYPTLKSDTVIPIELRGENRPVAIWSELQSHYEPITIEKRDEFLKKVYEYQLQNRQ